MPEYFGAPYAQEFMLSLPLGACIDFLSYEDNKEIDNDMYFKGYTHKLVFHVEMQRIDDQIVEFHAYSTLHLTIWAFFKQNAKPTVLTYGKIHLVGYLKKLNPLDTLISYDFYHERTKPIHARWWPRFLYEFFHKNDYTKQIYIGLGVMMLSGVILNLLSYGIFAMLQRTRIADQLCMVSIFLVPLSFIFIMNGIQYIYWFLRPFIVLDRTIRNTFKKYIEYSIYDNRKKKKRA